MGMSHNDNRLTQIKTDSEILSHYKNTLQPYPTLSPIFLSVTSVVVCFCWPTYSFRCPHIDLPLEGQLKVRVCNADFCNEVCSRCLYLDLGISFLVRSSFFWIQAENMQDRYSVVRTRTVLTYTHNHTHTHTHTWHTFFPPHTHTHIHTQYAYIQNDIGLSDTACAAEMNLESKKKQVPWWERRNTRSKRCARSWPTRNLKFQRRPID